MWLTYVLAVCVIAHGIILAIHIREDMKSIDRIGKDIDHLSDRISNVRPSMFDRSCSDYLFRIGKQMSFYDNILTKFLNDEK